MSRNVSWALIIVLLSCPAIVAQVQHVAPQRIIVGLERTLKVALAGRDDTTVIVTADNELVLEHQVQEFMVHTVYRDGRIDDNAHPEKGPNVQGFRLRVRVAAGPRYEGPIALTPEGYGSVAHPYWRIQVRYVRLPSVDEHLWVTLAMGSRADQKLLNRIDDAITEYVRQKSP